MSEGWGRWSIHCENDHPIKGETPSTDPADRRPCPDCGSRVRVIAISLGGSAPARDYVQTVRDVVVRPDPIALRFEFPPALAGPAPEDRLDRLAQVVLSHLAQGRLTLEELTGPEGPGAYRLTLQGDEGEILFQQEGASIDDVGTELAIALLGRFGPDPEEGP